MDVDDIIAYSDLVSAEGANLQQGMNFGIGGTYSVFLMSVRENAPYADEIEQSTGCLIYEGHDQKKGPDCSEPKTVNQPLTTKNGKWTENGRFLRAAADFKSGLRPSPELIKVYEKVAKGIWCYKGFFELVDANIVSDGTRNVFKFRLLPVKKKAFGRIVEFPHTRLIPSHVKIEVWRRDGGKCVNCGSTKHLHFDHDIPFSKGGSSLTPKNVRILCSKCNLSKSDKILSIMPWISTAASAAVHEIARRT